MKTTFPLIKMRSDKKSSIKFALSQFEAHTAFVFTISAFLIYFLTDNFEFNTFAAPLFVIAIFSFIMIFFPFWKSGEVTFSEASIEIAQKKDQPDERIPLRHITGLSVYTVQKTRFFPFLILNFVAEHNGTNSDFGIIIKRRKLKKQYLEVLESWYKKGLPVKEFDQLGNRIFKLNYKNYADVQTIKSKYGIEW